VLLAPIYLTFDNFFSMNAFEPVFWMACAAIVLRILNGGNHKLWLLFGLCAGLGILNKHSMLFFGSGIALGLLATSAREHFRQPWIWLGAGISFLCFLPNLLWEIRNGWPTLALFHAVMGTKYVIVSPWEYLWQQTLLTHPLAAPIWIAGLWFLLRDPLEKKYAVLAWAYFTVLAEMLILGKSSTSPGVRDAAGGGLLHRSDWSTNRTWLRPAIAVAAVDRRLFAPSLDAHHSGRSYDSLYAFWDVRFRGKRPQDREFSALRGYIRLAEQVSAMAAYGRCHVRARSSCGAAYNYGKPPP
jgi:hypothetical protein